MTRSKQFVLALSLSILTGTVCATAATAGGRGEERVNFKEFREQNLGLDRHAARQLFRESRFSDSAKAGGRPEHVRVQTIESFTPNIDFTTQIDRRLSSHTRQTNELGNSIRLKNGLDLDLTSNAQNIVLGKNLFVDGSSVQIKTGNGTKTVEAGSHVTPAEYLAVKQILSGGTQTLTVDQSGRASGGSVELDSITSNSDRLRAANYVNASNVTTIGDFSKGSDFRLLGDLSNYGTVSAVSGNSNARSGAIRADDINNFKNATITSNVDLTLDASGTLNNAGTINSSGALTLTAGGALSNSGTISAATNVDLGAANVNNRGTISSASGNVNLTGAPDAVLQVNNRRGTISALSGAINLRDSSYNGSQNSYITGGDLFSKTYNMHAGQGTAYTNVGELTGKISQTGNAAHVVASTDLMRLGEVCLTGDPTFFNTAGSIVIDGDLTVAENLVVVASGNVRTADGVFVRAGNATDGFDITFIAGAAFTNTGGENRSELNGGNTAGASGTVSLTGKSSKTGGSIILGSGSNVWTVSPGAPFNGDSGDLQMFAFDGKGADGIAAGMIDTTGATINTNGWGTGKNGNISLIAAGTKAPDGIPLKVGKIWADEGTGNNADITLMTRSIIGSEKKAPIVYDQNGVRTSTAFLKADKVNKKASLQINGTIDLRGTLSVMAGNDVLLNNTVTTSADAFFQAGHDIKVLDNYEINSTGSTVLRAGNNIGTATAPLRLITSMLDLSAGGDLANVTVFGNGSLGSTFGWYSGGALLVNAEFKTIDTSNTAIVSKGIIINAAQFTFGDVTASQFLQATSYASGIPNSSFQGTVTTPSLSLIAQGSIGTSVDRFVVPAGVTSLSVQAAGGAGSAFIQSNSTKPLTVTNVDLAQTLDVVANGSVVLDGSGFNQFFAKDISVQTDNGTLTANGTITAYESLSLLNTGAKGKIGFETNSIVRTAGASADNIVISLGPNSVSLMPQPIANVTVTGSTSLTGAAIKAKGPTNTINGSTKTVSINNGLKKGAITFGGNVSIVANQ